MCKRKVESYDRERSIEREAPSHLNFSNFLLKISIICCQLIDYLTHPRSFSAAPSLTAYYISLVIIHAPCFPSAFTLLPQGSFPIYHPFRFAQTSRSSLVGSSFDFYILRLTLENIHAVNSGKILIHFSLPPFSPINSLRQKKLL